MSLISLSGDPKNDAVALASFVQECETPLGKLPNKARRSDAECRFADDIHRSCRSLRRSFMGMHGRWLYEQITDTYTRNGDLWQLALAASAVVPGLVPTSEQMSEEERRPQAEKEGREIDQGIFFWGVLRDSASGTHLLRAMRRSTVAAQRLIPDLLRQRRIQLDTLEIEKCGSAIHVTLQNLACLNAEDNQLAADLEVAVDLALLDEETHVGVLRGGVMTHPRYLGKRVFSAGINLKALHEGRISLVRFLLSRELGFINKIMQGLSVDGSAGTCTAVAERKPWIAAVDTFAIGGGAQLLLVCDHNIAEREAFISLPAAQEGIIPGAANLRLPRFVGGRLARQMILSGRRVPASAVEAQGIIDEAVDASEMENAIGKATDQLSGEAVRANSTVLNMVDEPEDAFRCYMANFALHQAQRIYSHDVLAKLGARKEQVACA